MHQLFSIYLHRLLKVGVPKTFDESKKSDLRYIRKAGVRQFISTYNRVKDLKGEELLWGDEIEYGIFHIDPESKKVRLSLRAKEVSICFRIRICCPLTTG
jgi:glutamate--cysteine ligase catalytic subunit